MVAAWMLYAAAAGALVALVAAALDRAMRAAGRPTRGVWAAAVVASLLVPAAAAWRAHRAGAEAPGAASTAVPNGEVAGALALARLLADARARAEAAVEPRVAWGALDRPLLVAWGALSAAALAWLALSHRALARRRRAWRPAVVAGEPALVSPDVGPAVVGLTDARVVLPAWALALDGRRLALLLAHERAHVRARDPLLLAGAALATALVPWSPAAWWQLRRLRLAVEVDCDGRVLRDHPDVRAYGGLLLDVAHHAPRRAAPRLAVAFLASPTTSLEQRIRAMTLKPNHRLAARSAAAAVAVTALAAVACETLRPTSPSVRPSAAVRADTATSTARVASAAEPESAAVTAGLDVIGTVSMQRGPEGVVVAVQGPARRPSPNGVTDDTVRIRRGTGAPVPLHIIDGREIPEAEADRALAALEANAIDSVEILKSDAALRRYGERARGGVVRIVTKSPNARSRVVPGNRDGAAAGAPRRQVVSVRGAQPAPLYLIDGREIPAAEADSVVRSLDRSAIASVEVFKGEAAIAQYGERARAGGVVLILTKAPNGATRRDY